MTVLKKEKNLYVACERFLDAVDFAKVNECPPHKLCWVSHRPEARRFKKMGVIWVLGQISRGLAEELDYCVRLRRASVKYAEFCEKVDVNLG